MKSDRNAQLQKEHESIAPTATQFSEALSAQVRFLLSEERVFFGFPLETRIKSWASLVDKIDRKSLAINSIKELDDLIGVRLILLFRRDVNSTREIIEKNFSILSVEDTAGRLSEEQFGYGSIHYILEMPNDWLGLPTHKKFKGFRAEVQVRTMAQHVWAATSHALQYKQNSSVPPPLRRTIHRASALLETVDLEFERVLDEKEQYKLTLSNADETKQLNVDSLALLLDELLPPKNKDEFEPESYSDLLIDLRHFGIDTPSQLRDLIQTHHSGVLDSDAEAVAEGHEPFYSDQENQRIDRGVFFTHVGLARAAIGLEFGERWSAYQHANIEEA